MSTPNSKTSNTTNNNFNNNSSNITSPFKGSTDIQQHESQPPLNNSSPSRGPPPQQLYQNGMKTNYNNMNQRPYHPPNNQRHPGNQHQGQHHPQQQQQPHYYQQYQPPYYQPPPQGFQSGPPQIYNYQYPIIHPPPQQPPPPQQSQPVVVQPPPQLGHPIPVQQPNSPQQSQNTQQPHSPQHIHNNQSPQSPQNPRQQPIYPTPVVQPTPIISQSPQGVVIPNNTNPNQQHPNRKIPNNKTSVTNNIPPRTHSAPPQGSDIQEHAISLQGPGKFVPDKSSRQPLNTHSNQYIPSGVGYQGPPPPSQYKSHPPQHDTPYGFVPYYAPPPQGYPVYDHYGGYVTSPPYAYNQQSIPTGVGIPPTMSTIPYIKEKSSSKLKIIDPNTQEQINQSPPKSTPQPPPFSPPQFSLGNETIRQKLNTSTDVTKPPQTTTTTTTTATSPSKSTTEKDQKPSSESTITTIKETEEVVKVEPTKQSVEQVVEQKKDEKKESVIVEQPQEIKETPKDEVVKEELNKATNVDSSPSNTTTTTIDEEIKKVEEQVVSIDSKPVETVVVEEKQPQDKVDSSSSSTTEEEEGEIQDDSQKSEEDSTSSLDSGFNIKSSGEKITYSREFMISLQPKGSQLEEPRSLKDLKSQMENSLSGSSGGLNRSGNKVNNQNRMNMSGNYPNQPQMKMYPNQMQMKQYPQQKNYNNPNFKQYQQQIQQGFQQNQQQQFQQQQQQPQGYGITTFQQAPVQPPIATQVNENRWVPTEVNKLDDNQKVLRKAKFILNKITPAKFDVLTENLLELGVIDSEEVHKGTIQLIFDKALNEAKFCIMYCDLCKKIFDYERQKKAKDKELYFEQHKEEAVKYIGMDKPAQEAFDDEHGLKPTFRKLLLMTCQAEYEKAHKEFETSTEVLADNYTEQEKQDFEEKQFIKRKREFGLIKFIGELFNKEMLSEKILHGVLVALLGELNKPMEIKLECFCKLLTITGKSINEKASHYITKYGARMKDLTEQPTISQRLKFLIQNVIDLKNNNWVPKPDESQKPKSDDQQRQDDQRKSNTGVKTGIKNNFIANSIFTTKFNNPPPSSSTGKSPASSSIQPMIMKKPPGFNNNMQQAANNNYYGPNKNISMAQNLSNMNNMSNSNSMTNSSSGANKKQQEAWDKVKQSFEETISEYIAQEDKGEYIACVEEYIGKQVQLYPYLIATMLNSSIQNDSILELLLDLINVDKVFSTDDFKEGFSQFVSSLPDLYEDRPGAYKALGAIFYQCYDANKILPLSMLSSQLSKQLDQISNFISQIFFEFISQFKNPKEAASTFNDQKISITDFFAKKDKKTIYELSTKHNKDLSVFLDSIKDL